MDGRLQEIEKQQPETKDLSEELAQINKRLEQVVTAHDLEEFQGSTNGQITSFGADIAEIKEGQTRLGNMISEMPKRTRFQIEHRFTDRQRPYIITGIVLLFISVLSLFASFQLWRTNSELRDSDIKNRMVRLFYPQVSLDTDSLYNNNPKQLKIWVEQEEERLIAIRKAEENARQSIEQVERAKEELKKLKR